MKRISVLLLLVGACSGSKPAATTAPHNVATDDPPAGTEIERRRDAACVALGPRLTECAIADARATMSAEEFAKLDLEKTSPVHTQKFIESCQGQTLSSRQVRVYEVCLKEESECEPLIACLDNEQPSAP